MCVQVCLRVCVVCVQLCILLCMHRGSTVLFSVTLPYPCRTGYPSKLSDPPVSALHSAKVYQHLGPHPAFYVDTGI